MNCIRSTYFILLTLIIADEALCQFFDESYPSIIDFRSIGASAAAQEFKPRGSNTQPDSSRISFNTPLFLAEYRQMGLRVAFGYSSFKFNNDTRSEISLSAESVTDISFVRDRDGGNFFLPLILSTSFVQAGGSTNSSKDFNIANIGLGTGLKFKRISEDFGVQLTGVGVLYYSTAGFSVESGSSTAVIAELQFLFREIIGEGITVGYRFEAQAWSMTDKKLNYSRQFQGPYLGIFF
jgi:hypothetical protein